MARSRRRRAAAKGGRRSRGRKKSQNKLAVQVALKKGRAGVGVGVVSATASRSSSGKRKKKHQQEQQLVFWRKLLAAAGSALGAGCIYVVGNMAFALCVWTLYAGAAIFTFKFLFRRSVIAWAWRQRSLFF